MSKRQEKEPEKAYKLEIIVLSRYVSRGRTEIRQATRFLTYPRTNAAFTEVAILRANLIINNLTLCLNTSVGIRPNGEVAVFPPMSYLNGARTRTFFFRGEEQTEFRSLLNTQAANALDKLANTASITFHDQAILVNQGCEHAIAIWKQRRLGLPPSTELDEVAIDMTYECEG